MTNILKETVNHLEPAPLPEDGIILQVRSGKVKTLGNERSGIFKESRRDLVFVSRVGIVGDEHVYHTHGGIDRAIHQYAASHYAEWREEHPESARLFQFGGFGENLVATNLREENVCVGDVFRVGDGLILQVSEPRNPCYKLNIRFEWPNALRRIQKTGRVGWNFRVLQTARIQAGDVMTLIERPNPRLSVMNVQRAVHGKFVEPKLLEELSGLEVLTQFFRDLAIKRLETIPKTYILIESTYVTRRVKQLTFELKDPMTFRDPKFRPYAFAQIQFGPGHSISRSYSFVSGDLYKFSLGVARDDNSRGGSEFLHNNLKLGDEIRMSPSFDPEAAEHESLCAEQDQIKDRIVVIGGIGVTAFLPAIKEWEAKGLPYQVHYAVRSTEEAAFRDVLVPEKTTIYSKEQKERLDINNLIPGPEADGSFRTRIFTCGPPRLMDACRQRTDELGYPAHMVHFESFGVAAGGDRGDVFEVEAKDCESGRSATLSVPRDKSLLQILRGAGFDMMSSCETGKCGMCKITLCDGNVEHKGTALQKKERAKAMLSCVDRGASKIKIEID